MSIEKEFIKIVNDSPEIFHNYSMLNSSYQTMAVNAAKWGAEIERERIIKLIEKQMSSGVAEITGSWLDNLRE